MTKEYFTECELKTFIQTSNIYQIVLGDDETRYMILYSNNKEIIYFYSMKTHESYSLKTIATMYTQEEFSSAILYAMLKDNRGFYKDEN